MPAERAAAARRAGGRPDRGRPAGRRATLYHIPACPFSQRLEILLALKGAGDAVAFHVVDITVPRPGWLAAKTGGDSSLPVLETEAGGILRESLVILDYLEARLPDPPVAQRDPYRHAVEAMLIARESGFTAAGYRLVMNRDRGRRGALVDAMLDQYAALDAFLREHNPDGRFLFDAFGYAETVFAPLFMRFWFLDYYEGVDVPPALTRLRRWRDACLGHPAAQQVTREEIVKLYYDYTQNAGNGALPAGRTRSSFAFEPHWSARPWPPADKYGHAASDGELGLV